MRWLAILFALLVFLLVSCGDDAADDPLPVEGEPLGFIDGTEDGALKYPVIELWNVPECTCDNLISNTPHGTRIRIFRQKPDCPGAPYEVELLDGGQKGARGWVLERFILFGDEPPPSPAPSEAPVQTSSGQGRQMGS